MHNLHTPDPCIGVFESLWAAFFSAPTAWLSRIIELFGNTANYVDNRTLFALIDLWRNAA
jgi:hypothetical protein